MQKKRILATILAAVLFIPVVVRAHDGHDHTVMGTVSSISGKNLMVKGTDGKSVMVMLDAKTKITQGKKTFELSSLKVGDRVVAAGPEEKEMIMATSVKVGEAPAASPKKK